jgi:3-oxoacyl-[acyl-carrier protein] reductase
MNPEKSEIRHQKSAILVTGGAGEIGSAICKKFADAGFDVIITYNSNKEKAEKLLSELNQLPNNQLPNTQSTNTQSSNNQSPVNQSTSNHSIFHAPTTDAKKVEELRLFVKEKYGKLDILVNNAGITTPVPHADLEELSDDWIDKIMQTNFRGSFAMCRAMKDLLMIDVCNQMLDDGSQMLDNRGQMSDVGGRMLNEKLSSSSIINISSIAGIYGIGSNVAYCASKAALDSMTRSLARALAPAIRVVSVSPGFVEGEYTKTFDPAFLQNQLDNTPLNRFAMGQDVANAVFAVATQLTFSTGNIITVDGGRLL